MHDHEVKGRPLSDRTRMAAGDLGVGLPPPPSGVCQVLIWPRYLVRSLSSLPFVKLGADSSERAIVGSAERDSVDLSPALQF